MAMTIMKRVRFCAGHRLLGHGGKCEFLHGHNYVAEFFVSCDEDQIDAVGRVIDFKDLKNLLKTWLDDNWDHGFLLNEADETAINAIQMVQPTKFYTLPYNPTAENMARYLLEEVCPSLLSSTNARAVKVIIWETEDSYAEASVGVESVAQPQPMANAR